jgi:coenzyme F420 hydrogenase subunit beta
MDECDLEEGRCFSYCPRTEVDLDSIHKKVFGQGYQDVTMGPIKRVIMARAKDSAFRDKAQTGGVVSALIDFAMKEGIIDAAVLTQRDAKHLPQGRVIRNRDEILACAGSSYVAGSTLESLNKGPWEGSEKIGVIGTPCQVLALGKMKASPIEKQTPIDNVALVIGLFCTWALSYAPFIAYLKERVDGARIKKLDITPPPERLLKVTTDEKVMDIPIDEIRPFIRPTCGVCLDMTSELSDISIGTVEGVEGWNTVVTRTDRGEELIDQADAAGVIETQPLPEENLKHLKEASLLKKRRAISAMEERGEADNGYLILSQDLVRQILSDPTEAES